MPSWEFHRPDLDEYVVEKEFIINRYLKIKLIKSRTVIFVNEKPFHQCKYLLLNLAPKDFEKFDEIQSINDAFLVYNEMDKSHESQKQLIDPDTEFLGHCSNLQAWHEYDYDLRILHTNLSIPLLKKLALVGDERAIMRLKEEIANRIAAKNLNTLIFYLDKKYLDLFTREELEVILEDWLENDDKFSLLDEKRIWFPFLRELANRGIEKALNYLKEEFTSVIKRGDLEKYRFILDKDYLNLFSLEDLEHFYDLMPVRDYGALRQIHSRILRKAVKRRLKE